MTSEDGYERGVQTRREVLGADYDDAHSKVTTDWNRDFDQFATDVAWNQVWTREGLDRRTRSAVTIASLIALGRHRELSAHVLGARRNGFSDTEIREIFIHCSAYCGLPAVNSALRELAPFFEELE
jgi:alkylhydroperoxidase/carboxymuconolactone decarboxylase family protein YurZ